MMRWLLSLVALLALAAPVQAVPANAQAPVCSTGTLFAASTSATVNFGGATTATNLQLVVIHIRNSSTVNSVTNSAAEAFTQDRFDFNSGDSGSRGWIYSRANASSATSVTVTIDATFSNSTAICIYEVSGMETASVLDQTNSNEGSSNTADSGNITTTVADTFLVYVVTSGSSAGWTGDADFTNISSGGNHVIGWKILSATQTISATATNATSETWVDLIAAYKGTAGGGGGISDDHSRLTVLGVGGDE